MQVLEQARGTVVHTYLSQQPATSVRHARDAVLVRTGGAGYRAEAQPWQLGRIAACEFRDPEDVVVTPWQPASGISSYYLGILLAGRGTLAQRCADGTQSTIPLEPGRLVLYARGRPFRLSLQGPYHYLVLELLPAALGLDERSLVAASAREEMATAPSCQLLAGLLGVLPEQLPRLSPRMRLQTADVVTSLVAGGLSSVVPEPTEDRLFDDILGWIEGRLGDPSLDPAAIAAAHHISTRYLHKVFSRHELTVGGHVRSRRLELIRRDLHDTARARETVAAVARRWGVWDPSYLSKAFRARYGVSPREYREGLRG